MNAPWLQASIPALEEQAQPAHEHDDRHDRTTTLFFFLPPGFVEEAAGGPPVGGMPDVAT